MSDEYDQLEMESQEALIEEFGQPHEKRSQKIGKRLNWWYLTLVVLLIAFVVILASHATFFDCLVIPALKESVDTLGVSSSALTPADVLILYYVSKISTTAIGLAVLIWTANRVSRLQRLRSIHSDKAVMAKTMQAMLESGHKDDLMLAEGFRQLFSSSFEQSHVFKIRNQDKATSPNKGQESIK